MKILYVTSHFLPQSIGGLELHIYRLAKEISKTDQILIFCNGKDLEKEDYLIEDLRYDGINIRRINYTYRDFTEFKDGYINKKIEREFEKILDVYQPDIVDIHHLGGLSTTIIQSIKKKGIPLVLTLHDYWLICPKGQRIRDDDLTLSETIDRERCASCLQSALSARQRSPLWRLFEFFKSSQTAFAKQLFEYDQHIRQMLRLPDVIITPTEFFRREFIKYGVRSERIKTIGHGLDLDLFNNVTRTSSTKTRFGYIGSVIPSKGVHVLIEAFNKFQRNDVSLSIFGEVKTFHGDTGYGERLRKLLTPGKDVTFYGRYENEHIPHVLSEIDVLVVPSLWHESFSIVIREGFLARVPVIATDLGAMKEAIEDEKTGLLFERGNADHLFEQMRRLVEDKELKARISNNGVSVKHIRENAQELLTLYKELVGSKIAE